MSGKPALFTHDEVITLFHEFGHGLHHMLTRIETAGVAGISGVPWDAVELPSQFMENWCWEPDALAFISGHYETGEPLPKELLDKMLAAKTTGGDVYPAPAGVRPVRLPPARRVQPGAGAKILETRLRLKAGCRYSRANPGRFRTRSAISSQAGTPQATTATCGPTC